MNEFLLGISNLPVAPAGALWLDIDPTALAVGSKAFVDRATGRPITLGGGQNVTAQVIDSASGVKGMRIDSSASRSWVMVPYRTAAPATQNMLTGDFTIEMWLKFEADTQTAFFGNWIQIVNRGGILCWRMPGGSIKFGWGPYNENGDAMVSSVTVPLNTLTHFAVSRQGNTFRMFLNGNQVATFSSSTIRGDIGADSNFGAYQGTQAGYPDISSSAATYNVAKVKLYQKFCKYTGNFSPKITD